MPTFRIDNMNCGHCASTIKTAVKKIDPAADLDIDLSTKLVKVTCSVNPSDVASAITDAGFNPQPVE